MHSLVSSLRLLSGIILRIRDSHCLPNRAVKAQNLQRHHLPHFLSSLQIL
jgi:hypothetical protein